MSERRKRKDHISRRLERLKEEKDDIQRAIMVVDDDFSQYDTIKQFVTHPRYCPFGRDKRLGKDYHLFTAQSVEGALEQIEVLDASCMGSLYLITDNNLPVVPGGGVEDESWRDLLDCLAGKTGEQKAWVYHTQNIILYSDKYDRSYELLNDIHNPHEAHIHGVYQIVKKPNTRKLMAALNGLVERGIVPDF